MRRLFLLLAWLLYVGVIHVAADWIASLDQLSQITTTDANEYEYDDKDEYDEDATWCECVPWYLCEDNVINTDGGGLIDIRSIPVKNVEKCPIEMQECCGIPTDPEQPPVQKLELPADTPCNCVSYKQCPKHLIVSDRHGETCLEVVGKTSSHSKCPGSVDVCCASNTEVASLLGLESSVNDNVPNIENCDCVEPHLCDNLLPFSHNLCNNSNLVCCRPQVECECIDLDMCDEDGYIKTDGEGLLDFRTVGTQSETQGRCDDPCQICCKIHEEVPTVATTIQPIEECSCVEESQCNDGDEDDDNYDDNYGEGLINPKIQLCPNQGHICCKSPTSVTTANVSITATTQLPDTTYNCGKRNRKNNLKVRIMGFKDGQSQFGEFPWVATLLREEPNRNQEGTSGLPDYHFMGAGTLIHPRIVLTAAHKISNLRMRIDKLHIRLGEWDTKTDQEPHPHKDIKVETVVIHPAYNERNLKNDVALIFLKEEAPMNKQHIQKICMAHDISEVDPTDCVVNGWGKDGFGTDDGIYQSVLKSVTLPLVESDKCQSQLRKTRLGRYFRLHESFVCAGGEAGQDTCKGDGGGPLACARRDNKGEPNKDQYLLVGITAWGIGCGEEGVPGVYVNVPLYHDWIAEQIEAVLPTTTVPSSTETQGCPYDCPADFNPVCGSNGRTYGNPCEVVMAGCNDPTITLSHHGECEHVKPGQKKRKQGKKRNGKKRTPEERKKLRQLQQAKRKAERDNE